MNEKKVIVVGAGPAGCTAAIKATEAGNDVILLEARSRDSIFGNGQTSFQAFQNLTSYGDAVEHLSRYGIDVEPEYPYRGARLIGPSGRSVEIRLRRSHGYFIRRGGEGSLDCQLMKEAERSDADIRFETTVLEAKDNGRITYRKGKRIRSGKADLVIGADGMGTVAGRGITTPLSNRDVAVGIGYHFEGDHGFEPGIAECWLGSHLCPGEYAYVLPTENEVSVVATMRPHLMRTGSRPVDYLNRFMSQPDIRDRLGGVRISNMIMGGVPVTAGGPLGKNRILLTGEAARLTDPLLGFGMVNAVISGASAASCIGEEDPLLEYNSSMEGSILPDLRSRLRIRNDILDRIDDGSLDRVVDSIETMMRRSDPDDFFERKTRRKALISSFPDLINTGGIRVAVKYLMPFLYSNFSL
ncbi:MAG: NAD(P)/FAD-dependent oxidoreductase [Thermoplasmatota archaeon]